MIFTSKYFFEHPCALLNSISNGALTRVILKDNPKLYMTPHVQLNLNRDMLNLLSSFFTDKKLIQPTY